MKIFKLVFILFLSTVMYTTTFASGDEYCGTESLDSATFVNLAWFENNQYLLDLVDSIEGSCNNCRTSNDGLSKKIYQVPIKAHIYYHTEYPAISDAIV